MTGRRKARLLGAALCCAALLVMISGCGRKAKPEPRSASLRAESHHVSR